MLPFHVGAVASQVFAGAFEGEPLVLDEELYDFQQLYVIRSIVAGAASAASGPQFGEFLFPEADSRLRQIQQFDTSRIR